jgi:integrase/recombinase XerD
MATAEQSVADYLQFCRISQNLSENTVSAYRQDLKDFLKFAGGPLALDHVGSDVITDYVRDALDRRGLSPATVRRRVACLRGFFRWLNRSGTLTASPFEGIDLPIPLPRRLPRVIDRMELQRILTWVSPAATLAPNGEERTKAPRGAAGAGSSAACQTTYLAILIMLATGVRVGELTAVRIGDISLAEGAIKIRGKGGRERTVYVCNPQVAGLLERAIRARGGPWATESALLVNARGRPLTAQAMRLRLRRISEQAKLGRRVTPHMFRHTAATLLIEEGTNLRFVQRLLGHQSISTTEIYTHVSDTSLKTALLRANPLGRMQL